MSLARHLAFTVSSLKVLLDALHPVRASWYNIGLQLDIPHTTLDCFRQNSSDQSDLMREMLKHWLKTAVDLRPTWEVVVIALRSRSVDEQYVAEQLEIKYCTHGKKDESDTISEYMSLSEGIVILLWVQPNLFLCRERETKFKKYL